MRSPWRATLALLVAAAIAGPEVAAPEHVHRGDDDHHDAVAHRHFESHSHHRTISDDDEHVIWLAAAAVAQVTGTFGDSSAILSREPAGSAPSTAAWTPTRTDDASPPHGPPKGSPHGLRAPPASYPS